jgi:hypothetical protein
MRQILLSVLCLLSVELLPAQNKIILDQIRCFSANEPMMRYLKDPDIVKTIASQLSKTVWQKQQMVLVDSTHLNISFLEFNQKLPPLKTKFTHTDARALHLYLDLFEIDPFYYFQQTKNKSTDTAFTDRIQIVFAIEAWIISSDNQTVYREKMDILVSSAETPGIGMPYQNGIHPNSLAVLPETFTKFLNQSFGALLDTGNKKSQMEIALQPAFYVDNYIFPEMPRAVCTIVENKKGVITYQAGDKKEMIRMSEPVYEEIIRKGKNAKQYPDEIMKMIKDANSYTRMDFLFLKQEWRDVIRDENYLVQLVAEIDRNFIPKNAHVFSNFMNTRVNLLLKGEEIIARFSVRSARDIYQVPQIKLYLNTISDGFANSYVYKIQSKDLSQPESIMLGYDHEMYGYLNGDAFRISCSGTNGMIKHIYFNSRLISIAQGRFTIEKFALFDLSFSPEVLNQLFMIAFNRFLQ